ncbi:MAG: alanine--tRNA ligase [Cellvibrionales bacterium]|nr:alanine--tRNA ligase [Porticoccaceae bacterium]|tara:strand:+ start:7380 stop:9977 length:2598 start_codon:yes stop_codon:yes gene_type:complete
MKSADIRSAFLEYFAGQQHRIVDSSSLVPGNDPTLLFTNAGMVQFKDVFLGAEQRDYRRAVSSQRCVRAGGKHNDLENVGYTARHHTFFEMLGNFSFGDYFKRDAIRFGWAFLTEVLGLPKERLWVTVHISDDEAAAIWVDEIGIDPARLSRLDEDNFWQMGDTGPCGPCTEIFWDHGDDIPGGPPGSEDDDLDRYIEIWNLVFMQYERDANGSMTPLPKPSIDTGMGLERIAAVMQGVHNNYDIDLFQHLIAAAARIIGCADLQENSLKVVADHIRSCAFLVVDGVLPANEGRGYVLRRILRRALRHGHSLGAKGLFFYRLIPALAEVMGDAYPELRARQDELSSVIRAEEEQFARTLDKGMGVLESALTDLSGDTLPGELIFQLYDTYGFPTDLTNDIARERGLAMDMDGYQQCMQQQRDRARAASQFGSDDIASIRVEGRTDFIGYQVLAGDGEVLALYTAGNAIERVEEGCEIIVVLDQSPFYAESGGQVGDRGRLTAENAEIEVYNCKKAGDHHLHFARVISGHLAVGERVAASVDATSRAATCSNHSATHLLHAALQEVLGEHVHQRGSLVDSQRLRFDFSHAESVTSDQLRAVERSMNAYIFANTVVETDEMAMEQAQDLGAMALFGEKYGDVVRVVRIGGEYSLELCGGTHVQRTGEIGTVRILAESSVASGVRRVEAVSGDRALAYAHRAEVILEDAAGALRASRDTVGERVRSLVDENKRLHRDIQALQTKLADASGSDLMANLREINGVSVLVSLIEGANAKALRGVADQVRSKIERGVFVLAAIEGDRAALVAGVTRNLTETIKAGDLFKHIADQTDGKGGGRPDMAQGSVGDVVALPAALESVHGWIAQRLT